MKAAKTSFASILALAFAGALLVLQPIKCFSQPELALKPERLVTSTPETAPRNQSASEESFQNSPQQWVNKLESQVFANLNPNQCNQGLAQIATDIKAFNPALLAKTWIENYGESAIQALVRIRFNINAQMDHIPSACRLQVSAVLYGVRDIEDYIGETFYHVTALQGDHLDFKQEATPLLEKEKYNPYFLSAKLRNFVLEPGDVMITRGISFVSASIAQSTVLPSKFSHGVFVYVAPDGTPQTLESYISSGAKFFAIDEALKNENARIMIFRAKDRALAQRANDQIAQKIGDAIAKNGRVPYDYKSDYSEHEKLTCIEIPYTAYEMASDKKVILPQVLSHLMLTKPDLTKGLNIKPGPIFSPFNLETDDRFEMILEWTDYRLTQDQRNKDLAIRKMFELTETQNYVIHDNLNSIGARLIWKTRGIKPLWKMLGGIGDLRDLPPDMPVEQIVTSAKLNKAAGILLGAIRDWQATNPSHVYTNQEISAWIEFYIRDDRENYLLNRRADLHQNFRPYSLDGERAF